MVSAKYLATTRLLFLTALFCLAIAPATRAQTRPASKPKVEPNKFSVSTIVDAFIEDWKTSTENENFQDFTLVNAKIQKVTVVKNDKGVFVRVRVLPTDFEVASAQAGGNIPIEVSLPSKLADDVAKLEPGTLVNIDITMYSNHPDPPPMIHEISGFHGDAIRVVAPLDNKGWEQKRDAMVDWIRKNNAIKTPAEGGDNKLVTDMNTKIAPFLRKGGDVNIAIGAKLMKSGATTILCMQDGVLLQVLPTAEETAAMKLSATGTKMAGAGGDTIRRPNEFALAGVAFEGGAIWDPKNPLKGKAQIKETVRHDKVADCWLRLVWYEGATRQVAYSAKPVTGASPAFAFEFSAAGKDQSAGPHVVFVEVVRKKGVEKPEAIPTPGEVISDPAGLMLTIKGQ